MAKDYVAGWHFLRFAKITADTVASKFIPADRFSNNWVGCESFHVFFLPKFLWNKIQQLSWMQKCRRGFAVILIWIFTFSPEIEQQRT